MQTAQSVQGFSDENCRCGCGTLLPLTIYNRGWRFHRGHKPKVESPGKKAARVALKANPPGAVEHTSFAKTLEMARENLNAAQASFELATQAREEANLAEVSASNQVLRWREVVRALEGVVPRPTPATEFGAIAGRMATAGVAA